MSKPTLLLEQSGIVTGIVFVDSEGRRVPLEECFNGFIVPKDSANIVLTLIADYIQNRDTAQC